MHQRIMLGWKWRSPSKGPGLQNKDPNKTGKKSLHGQPKACYGPSVQFSGKSKQNKHNLEQGTNPRWWHTFSYEIFQGKLCLPVVVLIPPVQICWVIRHCHSLAHVAHFMAVPAALEEAPNALMPLPVTSDLNQFAWIEELFACECLQATW